MYSFAITIIYFQGISILKAPLKSNVKLFIFFFSENTNIRAHVHLKPENKY